MSISFLFANDQAFASKIFNEVVHAVVKKAEVKVYIHENIDSLERFPGRLHITHSCKDADIVILSDDKDIPIACQSKLLFGTRYKHMKNQDVIGAFFWQKGRPNILFYKKRLDQHHIELDPKFHKYVE